MDDIAWVSSTRAAAVLGLTPRTLYRLIDEGRVVAYRFGRVIRLKVVDLEAYLAESRIVPGTLGHLAVWDDDSPRGVADDEFLAAYDAAAANGADGVRTD